MTQAQTNFVISFKPFGLRKLYTEFEDGCMNCKMRSLKINRFLKLRRLISNLFHSMIVDGKKDF